jgi:hypothetical protein
LGLHGRESVGTVTDFYPMLGTFTTELYEVEIECFGVAQRIRVGLLPPLLASAFTMVTPDGWILGADFFKGRRLWFDASRGRIAQVPARGSERNASRPQDWLQHFLDTTGSRAFCRNVHCTTCGNGRFWKAIELEIARQLEKPFAQANMKELRGLVLLGLTELRPGPQSSPNFGETVTAVLERFISGSWRTMDEVKGEWVREFIETRRRIDDSYDEQRRAHEEYNSPEAVQLRREAKKAARQAAHQKMLAAQRERSLAWHARHPERDDVT